MVRCLRRPNLLSHDIFVLDGRVKSRSNPTTSGFGVGGPLYTDVYLAQLVPVPYRVQMAGDGTLS